MISFQRLWENIQSEKEEEEDKKGLSAIRTGLGIREDFWDGFLALLNNTSGLSELLDVPTIKIATWHNNVKDALKKVQDMDESPTSKTNQKLIHTDIPEDINQEEE